ncbi:MAG: bifunctional folylpolyglutamate synthase/dihydrofolate synthase [Flavobacteriales bacterium]|jgi:dihydrofolate synthase/folylpolyglutamate synthase
MTVTYEACIHYLVAQLPMFHRTGPAAYKPGMGNISSLCDILGQPQNRLRFVHVAGTNGKGSVSHLVASVLQEAGYRTGLHTSPHLVDFRERIRLNGALIRREDVVEFVTRYRDQWEAIQPSFFELSVAMAFWYYARQGADIVVLETGLGGRLDSTNIIQPDIAVITTIGLDHMNLLGDTVELIAAEKAGIIKKGIPVVLGAIADPARAVILARADEVGATVMDAREAINRIPPVPLAGHYQLENAATALRAVEALRTQGWSVSYAAIAAGFDGVVRNTGLRGRWQVIRQSPMLVCDVGHNEDGLRAVMTQVAKQSFSRLHIVLGVVNDKAIERMLALLPPGAAYYFCKADIPRGLDAGLLADKAAATGLSGRVYSCVTDACGAALNEAGPDDLVLVTGSFFTVAEVLAVFDQTSE